MTTLTEAVAACLGPQGGGEAAVTTPNLHELANTPGAGKATIALKEAGCWQEITEDGLPVWKVTVDVTIAGTMRVNVAAKDEADARKAAERWCADNRDLVAFDEYGDVEYEARSVRPTDERPDE